MALPQQSTSSIAKCYDLVVKARFIFYTILMKTSDLKSLVLEKIQVSEFNAFFRSDFADLGGTYVQVGTVLRELCKEQKLKRIGHGIYGRTKVITVEPFGEMVILSPGLTQIAPEALTRLGYNVVPSQYLRDYLAGISTQVPTGRRLGIQGKRTKRVISHDGIPVTYEYTN
jgi:hypothetical protein